MKITLAAARVNKGYTQKELAELIGISHYTLLKWEKGKSFPKVPQIQKLEELLGITYNDIIFLSDSCLKDNKREEGA